MVVAGNRERLWVVSEGSPLLLGLSSWGMVGTAGMVGTECPMGLVSHSTHLPKGSRAAEEQKVESPPMPQAASCSTSSTLPAPGEWSRGWVARRWAPVSPGLPALLPGWAWVFRGQSCGSLLLAYSVPTQAGPVCVEWTGVGRTLSLCCVSGP